MRLTLNLSLNLNLSLSLSPPICPAIGQEPQPTAITPPSNHSIAICFTRDSGRSVARLFSSASFFSESSASNTAVHTSLIESSTNQHMKETCRQGADKEQTRRRRLVFVCRPGNSTTACGRFIATVRPRESEDLTGQLKSQLCWLVFHPLLLAFSRESFLGKAIEDTMSGRLFFEWKIMDCVALLSI
jgi:hypothetical protein